MGEVGEGLLKGKERAPGVHTEAAGEEGRG